MDAQEYISTRNILERNSYTVRDGSDGMSSMIVLDPVTSRCGQEWRIEYKAVTIRSFSEAIKFLCARE